MGAKERLCLPRRLRHSFRPHALLRYVLLGLALVGVYFGGEGLAFFYRQRAANAAADLNRLSLAPLPTPTTRLMVFAPHCDDETLGCGGLIQKTRAAGGAVRAVMLTNGDGFRTAVERQVRSLQIGPSDYIQFAALRQQETLRALGHLGLPSTDVLFFGYPDRGLMPLWNDYWRPEHPYTSAYTRRDRSPYALTFDPGSRYCGRDVVADIEAALRAFHPTLVTVTHPSEDHPDHAAAAAFVTYALAELQADPHDAVWARRTRLEYYLVHRGDWPLPQGTHLSVPLTPPAEMLYLDTRWRTLPLSAQETAQKAQAIDLYPSQTALMGHFLTSFARRNELFGEIAPAPLAVVPDHTIRVDASAADWASLPPVLLDPVRDNMLRDLQGGGDIRAIYACRDSHSLYLRLDTRQPVSSRITYTLRLRPFGFHGETGAAAYTVQLHAGDSDAALRNGLRIAARGRTLEAAIPWRALTAAAETRAIHTLAISAETTLGGVEVDKTGVRFLQNGEREVGSR